MSRTPLHRWLLPIAALAVTQTAGAQSQSRDNMTGVWALTNARIETVTKGTIDRGTVVIRNGVIEAVGATITPPADAVVVDLSGAHRLSDPAAYAEWYGFDHPRPEALGSWSYGLPELSPPSGTLIASPGCYATAVLLALAPLVGAVDPAGVVVDAKSGVSGAGRALRESSHAGAVLDNVTAYRVGTHQHEPEIAQLLGFDVCFVPHLLPVRRGLVATCYVEPAADDLRERLEAAYAASPVVSFLPEGGVPDLARVQGTDAAEVGLFFDRATTRAIVICALDNLGKGAAGQAVQNANLALGLDETAGLRLSGVPV